MLNTPTNNAPALPPPLALRLAKLASVPAEHRDEFCEHISKTVQNAWQRDRRSTGQKPSRHLIYAADAARTLQKEFARIRKDDRDWVETIKGSPLQIEFLAGKIQDIGTTIINVSMLLNASIGRQSPLPPYLEKKALKTKDQMLRELVFGLLTGAKENGGKLTFDKNSGTGTLVTTLDRLRKHLPKDLVRDPLPTSVIQRLKADFYRLRR